MKFEGRTFGSLYEASDIIVIVTRVIVCLCVCVLARARARACDLDERNQKCLQIFDGTLFRK